MSVSVSVEEVRNHYARNTIGCNAYQVLLRKSLQQQLPLQRSLRLKYMLFQH
jgi:hypothetical protein